jgi:hypothetical protein
LIIAVVIFVLIIIVFYALLNSKTSAPTVDLRQQSRNVVSLLSTPQSQPCQLFVGNKLNESCWVVMCDMEYEDLKVAMNYNEDFCIFLEDYNNNLIPCHNDKTGIGPNSSVNVSQNLKCGEKI